MLLMVYRRYLQLIIWLTVHVGRSSSPAKNAIVKWKEKIRIAIGSEKCRRYNTILVFVYCFSREFNFKDMHE